MSCSTERSTRRSAKRRAGPKGWAEGLGLFSVVGLVWLVRKRGAALPLTAVAALCQTAAMGVFLVYVQPANVEMSSWPLDSIPPDWTGWRDQWEYAHAARAVLHAIALAAQALAIVWETPAELQSRSK